MFASTSVVTSYCGILTNFVLIIITAIVALKTLIQSLIYSSTGPFWVTDARVTGHLLLLKVHASTLLSINERIKSTQVEYLHMRNTKYKKIKTFYNLHILPSIERGSGHTQGEQRHKKLPSSINLDSKSLKVICHM